MTELGPVLSPPCGADEMFKLGDSSGALLVAYVVGGAGIWTDGKELRL